MSTRSVRGVAAPLRDADADATFREDFLLVVSRVGLGRHQAAALVEASIGRPFGACGAGHLLPILDELLALAQRTTRVNGGPACGV